MPGVLGPSVTSGTLGRCLSPEHIQQKPLLRAQAGEGFEGDPNLEILEEGLTGLWK